MGVFTSVFNPARWRVPSPPFSPVFKQEDMTGKSTLVISPFVQGPPAFPRLGILFHVLILHQTQSFIHYCIDGCSPWIETPHRGHIHPEVIINPGGIFVCLVGRQFLSSFCILAIIGVIISSIRSSFGLSDRDFFFIPDGALKVGSCWSFLIG